MNSRHSGLGKTLVVLALVQGCGAAPRTLTAGDVTTVPAGTGMGSVVSGGYAITKAAFDDCFCRAGDCSTLHAQPTGRYQVVQQNGALTLIFNDQNGSTATMTGGVNADYSFKVGSAAMNTISGLARVTHAWTLMTGMFAISNGRPVSVHAEESSTVLSQVLNRTYDCDVRLTFDAESTGP